MPEKGLLWSAEETQHLADISNQTFNGLCGASASTDGITKIECLVPACIIKNNFVGENLLVCRNPAQ